MTANDSQNGLTEKQERAIIALLSQPTTKAAAKSARISEVTIHRWLNDPAFSGALKDARTRAIETALSALQGAAGKAVETLIDVMDDQEAQPASRVSAARTTLEMMIRARDAIEIEDRLRAIEARLKDLSYGARQPAGFDTITNDKE